MYLKYHFEFDTILGTGGFSSIVVATILIANDIQVDNKFRVVGVPGDHLVAGHM